MTIRFHCPRRECRADRCPAKRVFSCLSASQDETLGRERLARRYEAGQVVVHHDTPALAVLGIHSGVVKLTRSSSNGRRVTIGLRGPGEFLGLREVLSQMPYQVSAETLEPSVVCSVPREAFLGVVRDCPELAMRLLGLVSKDYLLAEEQLVARTHLSVRARTARLLLTLSHGVGDDGANGGPRPVTMAREEMAMMIGTTRETLSRTLGQLAGRGAITLSKHRLGVRDVDTLERLSE